MSTDAIWRSQLRGRLLAATLVFVLTALVAAGCSKQRATPTPPAVVGTPAAQPVNTLATAAEYFQLGNSRFQQQDLTGAEQAYKQAIALDGAKASYHANLGVTYYTMGQLDDAVKSYQAGLKLNPNDAELNYLLGAVYLQQDRLSDAEAALNKANQLDPNLPEPYFGLGVLYKLQGKRDEAIKAFEKFIAIGPGQDPAALPAAQAELKALQSGQ